VMLLPSFSRSGGGAALRNMAVASAVIFLLLVLGMTLGLGFDVEDPVTGRILGLGAPLWALGTGTVAGIALGLIKPRWLVGAGSLLPLLILVGTGWGGYALAGLYGIGLVAVGMLATVGTAVWASAYRAVAGSTRLIARVSRLGSDARRVTDDLGAAGETLELGGRGFAITAAGLAVLAMFAAYASVIELAALPLASAGVILGVILGVTLGLLLPPTIGALSTLGVVRGGGASAREAERQYEAIPGLLQGVADADAARSVVSPIEVVLRDLAVPTLVTLLLPVIIGYGLGPAALAALLVGAMVSGIPLALFMAHAEVHPAGGAAHPAFPPRIPVMLQAMFATPYRFAAAASITTLIKLLAAVSLVLAPLLAARVSS
ncbi:MAG: sodium/proton-translocating pyrophosphatase, partial [Gemmatimonadota bacterium]|nr:sodium/proton-translocating pyrophosphatase [Gemmatimonadota bacterium]